MQVPRWLGLFWYFLKFSSPHTEGTRSSKSVFPTWYFAPLYSTILFFANNVIKWMNEIFAQAMEQQAENSKLYFFRLHTLIQYFSG